VLLEAGGVRILDRRVFPFSVEYVDCATLDQVARAIEQMVTQSNGPFYAAGGGMVLAAREAERQAPEARAALMQQAAARLKRTRPTNNNIGVAVGGVLSALEALEPARAGFAERVEARVRDGWAARRARIRAVGENAAGLIPDGARILTHCWSEGALVETMGAILCAGRRVEVWCTETRPYLQGARLTAHSVAEMGIPATVITDGMVARAIEQQGIALLMTAADRITMSGHVVNKVGTLTAAIAARHFRIPYYATVVQPDAAAPGPGDVEMEQRDGDEVLHCLGHRTATPLAQGWYPAFDITPPELVSAIVTEDGVFAATTLPRAYATINARR
jgi:methylthioribose-1-phosphate isomerase